jgi:hypothetical protein
MADLRDDLTDDELAELEAAGTLSDEIAKKWDPERLLRLVAKQAGRGEKLDQSTRSKFEARLGVDLGRVRIYTGEFAQQITRQHRAEALTIGNTGMILMSGASDLSPDSTAGQALLAHELTHVAQAERGVQARSEFGAAPALSSDAHEAEAEGAADAERAAAAGGAAGAANGGADAAAAEAELEEAVIKRVMELFADDARVDLLRNGEDPFRP